MTAVQIISKNYLTRLTGFENGPGFAQHECFLSALQLVPGSSWTSNVTAETRISCLESSRLPGDMQSFELGFIQDANHTHPQVRSGEYIIISQGVMEQLGYLTPTIVAERDCAPHGVTHISAYL